MEYKCRFYWKTEKKQREHTLLKLSEFIEKMQENGVKIREKKIFYDHFSDQQARLIHWLLVLKRTRLLLQKFHYTY